MSFTVTIPEIVLTKQSTEILLFVVIYILGIFTTRWMVNDKIGDGKVTNKDKFGATSLWLFSPIVVPIFIVVILIHYISFVIGSIILVGKK